MKSKKVANVDRSICVSCGTCVKQCPRNCIRVCNGCYAVINEDGCVGCGRCAKICPVGCITVKARSVNYES